MKASYAIFDLDYTLLPHDTIFLFANYILKKQRWRIFYIFFILITLPFFILKIINSRGMKQIFLSFIWNINKEQLEEYSKNFVQNDVIPKIYPELLEEIKHLKKQKKILILNTAAPEFYAKYIAQKLEFDYCIATPFDIKNKQPNFPRIIGENNKSYAKIKRMLPILKHISEQDRNILLNYIPSNPKKPEYPITLKNSISYSDSIADLPLLRLTEKSKIINPENKLLIKEAKEKNWEIINTQKPFRNKLEKYFLCFKQCLGLYVE